MSLPPPAARRIWPWFRGERGCGRETRCARARVYVCACWWWCVCVGGDLSEDVTSGLTRRTGRLADGGGAEAQGARQGDFERFGKTTPEISHTSRCDDLPRAVPF